MDRKYDDESREGDANGAVEEAVDRSKAIDSNETLGYKGEAHGEHSGQETPPGRNRLP